MQKNIMKRTTLSIFALMIVFILTACSIFGISPSVSQEPGGADNQAASPTESGQVIQNESPQPSPTVKPPTAISLPTQTPQPTAVPPLSENDLKNATYRHPDFDPSGAVQLTDGKFEKAIAPDSASKLTIEFMQSIPGDLNVDGVDDAAVLLATNGGGTGAFVYLAAMINREGKPENIATELLGDRVKVESAAIQQGIVLLHLLTQGPEDPMCCPSQKVSVEYLLDANHLVTKEEKAVAGIAREVIQALKDKDMVKLSAFIHPTANLRFTPYPNVKEADLVFTPEQLKTIWDDQTEYLWGNYDGSGEPIQLTFTQYYEKFVYNADFAAASQVSYNKPLSSGNMIDNSREFYPGSIIVEYYLPGTEQYSGMDWQSLRLVFRQYGGKWMLVGIIHGQWTI